MTGPKSQGRSCEMCGKPSCNIAFGVPYLESGVNSEFKLLVQQRSPHIAYVSHVTGHMKVAKLLITLSKQPPGGHFPKKKL